MSSQPQPPSTNNFFQNRPVEFTVPISQPSNPSPPVQPLKPFSTFSELPSIKPSEPFTTFSENSFNNENPIVEIVSNTFDNSLPMENLIHPQPDNNNHLESSLPSLPQPVPENVGITSFVDSDRLNAGQRARRVSKFVSIFRNLGMGVRGSESLSYCSNHNCPFPFWKPDVSCNIQAWLLDAMHANLCIRLLLFLL